MQATGTRILDATLRLMSTSGLARLALEEVAEEAGTSRQTVYRYFANRDALITAVILREEEVFLERVTAAGGAQADLPAALQASLTEAFVAAREHPLLQRLLTTEPQVLVPFLTTGSGPLLNAARPALTRLIAAHRPDLDPEVVSDVADMLTRLFISFALNPAEAGDDATVAAVTKLVLSGLGDRAPDAPDDEI